VDCRAATPRAGPDLARARPGRPLARHGRRRSHRAAGAGRAARCRVVGAFAGGARPHPLWRGGAQRPARRGSRRIRAKPRHGAARPRPHPASAGGIRGVSSVIHGGDLAILLYFLVLNSFYALLLVLSVPEIWEQTRLAEDEDFQRLMQSDALPPITILVPAHNESATIETSVTAILTLEYRSFEVVVVNDGSKDDTLERLRHAFELYEVPRTYPEGIATSTVRAGRVTDARVPRRFLPGVQVVEYLRAFLFGRLGWNRLGGSLVISGAFGLFRKEYLHAIGGYRVASVVEDLDLVVRLHRHLRQRRIAYEIPFIPDPVAWTEVPESGRILSRQRERWHRGLLAAMWLYKGMLFNPRYGRV